MSIEYFSRIKEGSPYNGVVRRVETDDFYTLVYDSSDVVFLGNGGKTTTMKMMFCATTLQEISDEINRLILNYDENTWGFALPEPQTPVSHEPIPTESWLKNDILIYMDRWSIPYDPDESQTKAELVQAIEDFWS